VAGTSQGITKQLALHTSSRAERVANSKDAST
jgi:hypothetical protein